jgi:PAS domain S-box-containing protein
MPHVTYKSSRPTTTIVAFTCAAYAVLAGVVTLLGWKFDLPRLTDWTGEGISMFPIAAICSISVGIGLMLLVSRPRDWSVAAVRCVGGMVLFISGLTLLQHITGADFGIDTLILSRPWGQTAAAAPMRMGPPASTSFAILGTSLILSTAGGRLRRIASWLGLATIGIASLSLAGYWFGADQLFGVARFTGIALVTSTIIAALSIGVMASVPDQGLAAEIRRDDAGGSLLRRLIVAIIVIPLVLGWLRLYGQQAGYYDTAFGTALRTLVEIALLFALLWWTARSIGWHASTAESADARLAAIVQSSEDAIVSKSLDGVIESWNQGAERTFGYTSEEAVGRHISLIIPPERLDEEAQIIARLRNGEPIEHFETVRVRKDGTRIRISLSVSPIRDGEGRVIGASKIARNITDRRQTEERLRAVVEATTECVKIVSPDGAIEFMNHAGLAMIEADAEAAVKGGCIYDLIAPEHREDWIAHHKRVCGGERQDWEFEIIGLKGTRRWMESRAVPLQLPDGRVAHMAVSREVTARKKMELEREQLLESERIARGDAERASRLKDEFLATVSHELRTPLNAILGWSQLLDADSGPDDLEQGLDTIQRNARAQAQLIEDLLDMSRIISGKVRLDVQPTDMAKVMEAAIDSIRLAADAKEIEIRQVLDPFVGTVSGDPSRLQQVIWNLLTNAIKFTPKGGKVDVILERVNSHLEITVHDNGIGIAPENLPFVFERFRQEDASTTRAHGGLGLGLSIVKQLVELHGGTVRAKSAGKGAGATFIVCLPKSPIRVDENREHPTTSASSILDVGNVDLSGVKVLVVDDESDALTLIDRVLRQCGADVHTAASSAEGLAQLRAERPHVLVSDIGMPVVDGYQFIREVRSLGDAAGGGTPAIALTAFARSEDRMRAMLAGYQVHVAKPIDPQELAVTVQSLSRRINSPT